MFAAMRKSFRSAPRSLSFAAVCALLAASPVAAQLRDEPSRPPPNHPKVQPDTDRLPTRPREFVVPPPGDKPDSKSTEKDGKRSEVPGKKRAEPPKDKQADTGPLEHKGPGGIIETPAKKPVKRALGAVIPDAPI
jgi:hypothetical protein